MEKLVIKVRNGKFSYWKAGKPSPIKDAPSVIGFVEKKLGCDRGRTPARLKDKYAVVVDYGRRMENETLTTDEPAPILYALTAFIEDYVGEKTLSLKYRRYGGV